MKSHLYSVSETRVSTKMAGGRNRLIQRQNDSDEETESSEVTILFGQVM